MKKELQDHVYNNSDIQYTDLIRSKDRVDSTGEIFTPVEIVNKMLDMVNPEDWSNPEITMLEPSCGDGNFVVKMIERFMDGLKDIIIDEEQRFKHIVENQVFALDIMSDNINATLNRIDDIFGFSIRDFDHNILNKDSLAYDCQFGKDYTDEYGVVHKAEPKYTEPVVDNNDMPKKVIVKSSLNEFI